MALVIPLLLVIIGCHETYGITSSNVITQPQSTTVCEGGIAVFTCTVDFRNISMVDIENINWWRTRLDHDSPTDVVISPYTLGIDIMKNISGNRLTSVLMITSVKLVHVGPYWLGFTEDKNLSIKAFLNVVTPPAIAFPKENITDISFVVQWDTLNQSADRYILMWTNGTTPIQSVTVDETSYTVTGLTPNTTYTVSVTVVNSCTGSLSTNAMVMTRMSNATTTATNTTVIPNVNPTATITMITPVIMSTVMTTTSDSGGNSVGAIVGGVIGGIIILIIIVIIIIALYKLFVYQHKDNDGVKKLFYKAFSSDSNPNGKNTLAASNSLMYSEVHKSETKTAPYQNTDTGELNVMSTKVVDDKDTQNNETLIYTYARVDTERMVAGMTVPHQTAADGIQYAVSTKATTKDDHVSNNDASKQQENQEIKYADLQPLSVPPNVRGVINENSSQYTKVVNQS